MEPEAIYLEMYKEWRTHVRHHETQRSAIMTVCAGLAGALVAYVGNTYKSSQLGIIAPSIFLILLGALAFVTSQKHYERIQRALAISDEYRNAIDRIQSSRRALNGTTHIALHKDGVRNIFLRAETVHKKRYPSWFGWKLHMMWNALCAVISAFGIFFFVYALRNHSS